MAVPAQRGDSYLPYPLGPSTQADEVGRFRLDGLPAGETIALAVEAEGYLDKTHRGITVEDGEAVRGVEVVMERGVHLLISVFDREGHPVENATISFWMWDDPPWTAEEPRRDRGTQVTDSEGRAEWVAPRLRVDIYAEAQGFERGDRRVRRAAAGDTVEVAITLSRETSIVFVPIDVLTDEPIEVYLGLITGRFYRLDAAGKRVDADRYEFLQPRPTEDGTGFKFQGPPIGTFELQLISRSHLPVTKTVTVVESERLDLGPVRFTEGAVYVVEVVDAEGNPVEDATINVTLTTADGTRTGQPGPRPGRTDAEGRWESAPMVGTHARFSVSHPEHSNVLRFLELREPMSRTTLRIELVPGATIEGTVTIVQGEPAVGVRVRLYRIQRHGSGWTTSGQWQTETDAAGAYHFEGIGPGRYAVAAGDVRVFDAPPFHVRTGQDVVRDLVLGYSLRGTLYWHDGSPATQLQSEVVTNDGKSIGSGRTDSHGRFEFALEVEGAFPAHTISRSTLQFEVEPGRIISLRVGRRNGWGEAFNPDLGDLHLPNLDPAARSTITLCVVNGETSQPAHASVQLSAWSTIERISRVVEVDGHTELTDLPPDATFILSVVDEQWARSRISIETEAAVQSEATLTVFAATTVRFRVNFADRGVAVGADQKVSVSVTSKSYPRTFDRDGTAGVPIAFQRLGRGQQYVVEVSAEGYRPKAFTITVQEETIAVELEPRGE